MPSYVYIAEERDTPRILLWVQMKEIHFPQVSQVSWFIAHQIPVDVCRSQPAWETFAVSLSRTLPGKPQAQ